jgi:cytochrome oxidase assembly protein ShyY1
VRFLFSRRWVLFFISVVAMAYGASLLGQWQFHRLDDKRVENKIVARNLDAAPVPVKALLAVGKAVNAQDEWRRVTATGTWDDAHTIVLKYQTNAEGSPGIDVATPLVTIDGPAVIVDRGWMSTDNSGGGRPKTPAPTTGKVTVTGWVRVNATGGASKVSQLQTRALSSEEIAKVLDYPVYGGFLDLSEQSPPPVKRLGHIELPDDTSEGPHFFYGLQWWFFGALAVFGFAFLVYDEWRRAHPRT